MCLISWSSNRTQEDYYQPRSCTKFGAMATISFIAVAAIALLFILTDGYYFPPEAIGVLAGGCAVAFIVGVVFLSLAVRRYQSQHQPHIYLSSHHRYTY